jgi:hypothetical protein
MQYEETRCQSSMASQADNRLHLEYQTIRGTPFAGIAPVYSQASGMLRGAWLSDHNIQHTATYLLNTD